VDGEPSRQLDFAKSLNRAFERSRAECREALMKSARQRPARRSKTNDSNKLASIIKFARLGAGIVPLTERGKDPAIAGGVHAAFTDRKEIKRHFRSHRDHNYGVALGNGIFVVDVDGEAGRANWRALRAQHEPLPDIVTVKTRNGYHYYFRCDDKIRIRNSAGKLGEGIDVRGDGGYAVGPGSIHPSGFVYRFASGRGLGEVEIARAPAWLIDIVRGEDDEKVILVDPIPAEKLERACAYVESARLRELQRLRKAPNHQRNDTLNVCAFKVGQLLPYDLLNEQDVVRELTKTALEIGLDASEIERTIRSGLDAGRQNPRRLPFLRTEKQITEAAPPQKTGDELTKNLAKLGETDTDNAHRFATRFAHEVIYTPGRGWLMYDGKRWQPDSVLRATELAKKAARLINDEAQYRDNDADRAARARFAQVSLARGALDRMLDLAKGLLVVEDSKLDADPWLLNTETGTIDLTTGRLEPHDPRDLLTKIAPVAADPKAKCPTFRKFLRRITGNDVKLRAFMRKAFGCTLTGITSEQVLFFVYGKGSNGKSTLVNCFRTMLGDYGCHTPTETLLVKQYDNNIPVDLARLAGVRMVTAIEANYNRHLDEARIKAMTGGEPITARFMRQNLFEFVPEFKLWFVANDRPRVRGTDDAFWRRMRVIPLETEIPREEQDLNLPSKLRAEWPGILAWAVRGCLKWRRDGLDEPDAVIQATGRWRQEVDHVKRFFSETLLIEPNNVVPASALYAHYAEWCNRNGEQPLTTKELKKKLEDSHDMTHKRTRRGSDWIGVKLKF
jgi:putative DNA primase/helicase